MSMNDVSYIVSGVCCITEERVLRSSLDGMPGGGHYTFNPVTSELRVPREQAGPELLARIRSAGFDAREKRVPPSTQPFLRRHRDAFTTGLATLCTAAGLLLPDTAPVPRNVLFTGAILLGGWQVVHRAYLALRLRTLDMNVLMAVAVLGAVAIDQWAEAAAVIVLFAASLMLERYSATRTRRAIESLLGLAPDTACLITGATEEKVPASEVDVGATIAIRPGERIPLDGTVVRGSSTVNEAPITGESTPVAKGPGAYVYSGSINERGMLTVAVRRQFEDSTLHRMVHLIEDAHTHRAPLQTFVDAFARVYTPVVFAIAILVAVAPPLLGVGGFAEWFYRALVLLVIACPCALVISTPVTLVSALTSAAHHGVLVKGGRVLEALRTVSTFAFDKTGTLTEGRFRVTDMVMLNSMPRGRVLAIVAALEHHSEHPVADALRAEALHTHLDHDRLPVTGFEALPGSGIRGTIEGTTYTLGSGSLAAKEGFLSAAAAEAHQRFSREGKMTAVLGTGTDPLCVLALEDRPRSHAREVVERLRHAGVEHLVMLSGDHDEAARRVAGTLGMTEVRAGLLPGDKLTEIRALQRQYGNVAMVGDGINDAPALAAATVGIAMGVSGTDIALETAEIVLMSDDLQKLPYLLRLSERTFRVVRQNVALALGLKLVFLVLSLTGHASLWAAILADDGAALAVILNGLRLLSFEDRP